MNNIPTFSEFKEYKDQQKRNEIVQKEAQRIRDRDAFERKIFTQKIDNRRKIIISNWKFYLIDTKVSFFHSNESREIPLDTIGKIDGVEFFWWGDLILYDYFLEIPIFTAKNIPNIKTVKKTLQKAIDAYFGIEEDEDDIPREEFTQDEQVRIQKLTERLRQDPNYTSDISLQIERQQTLELLEEYIAMLEAEYAQTPKNSKHRRELKKHIEEHKKLRELWKQEVEEYREKSRKAKALEDAQKKVETIPVAWHFRVFFVSGIACLFFWTQLLENPDAWFAILIIIFALYRFFYHLTRKLTWKDGKCVYQTGVIIRQKKEISVADIKSIQNYRDILDWFFWSHGLRIETESKKITIPAVRDANDTRIKMNRVVKVYQTEKEK